MKLCVITVAKDEDGNQYDCLFELKDVELLFGGDPSTIPDGVATHRKTLFVQGELLVLGDYEREVSGKGRKPSKWSVEYELFDFADLDKAVQRSIEVKDW